MAQWSGERTPGRRALTSLAILALVALAPAAAAHEDAPCENGSFDGKRLNAFLIGGLQTYPPPADEAITGMLEAADGFDLAPYDGNLRFEATGGAPGTWQVLAADPVGGWTTVASGAFEGSPTPEVLYAGAVPEGNLCILFDATGPGVVQLVAKETPRLGPGEPVPCSTYNDPDPSLLGFVAHDAVVAWSDNVRGIETHEGTLKIDVTGSAEGRWALVLAEGDEAGTVLADGDLSRLDASDQVFRGDVGAARTCFVLDLQRGAVQVEFSAIADVERECDHEFGTPPPPGGVAPPVSACVGG